MVESTPCQQHRHLDKEPTRVPGRAMGLSICLEHFCCYTRSMYYCITDDNVCLLRSLTNFFASYCLISSFLCGSSFTSFGYCCSCYVIIQRLKQQETYKNQKLIFSFYYEYFPAIIWMPCFHVQRMSSAGSHQKENSCDKCKYCV